MRHAVVALLLIAAGTAKGQTPEEAFPIPQSLQAAVDFWTRVYTEVDTQSGFIHDSSNLGVIYHTVRFETEPTPRQRRREVQRLTQQYRDVLNKLAEGSRSGLSTLEARVLSLWPAEVSDAELKTAAGRLRFQLGQADRFRAGLQRSGQWKPYIEQVLAERGLPRELVVLPHVESSFDPTAYSKVGAAGMWQFTRSTGLRYMRIDHIIDERRDPFLSTLAAARLLEDNYSVIQSWPLALTAYNHGLAGMRRAVRMHNTRDIGTIVANYTGRTFGFASRNFYAAFAAALEVDSNAEKYFGSLRLDPPSDTSTIEVPDYMTAGTIARSLGLAVSEVRQLNPALMDSVWAGDKYVPKGFALRLPAAAAAQAATAFDRVPATERFAAQQPDEYHRVRRGETLSGIAAQYRISLAALVRANNLRSRNFIREGQMLTLPIRGSDQATALAATAVVAAVDGEYVVRRGDSVALIARRLGVTEQQLVATNSIRNKNRIYPGQVLKVPGSDQGSPAADTVSVVLASNETAAEEPVRVAAATVPAPPPVLAPELERAPELEIELLQRPAEAAADESELDPSALASMQARLAADPSDYSIDADQSIEVQELETLGHYADWLQIRTQRLRDINGLSFRQAVVVGQRIQLDLSNVNAELFEQRRMAYQEGIQESFFSAYQIAEIRDHVIRAGESLWLLAQRTYNVPVWLLRQYNPDLDLDRINPGTIVKFPRLQRINGGTSQVSTGGELG